VKTGVDGLLLEACVTTVEEAVMAARSGAGRLELCRDLRQGGLAPSTATLRAVRAAVDIPVRVMVRPDSGSFRPTVEEVGEMKSQIEGFLSAGADGIVLGVLGPGGIDVPLLADLMRALPCAVTFHRAFDEVTDSDSALEALIEMGVSHVLTSGGAPTALAGASRLRRLAELASDRVTILGAGRIRADHVLDLVERTGLSEVHARASAVPALASAIGERG
jgi:copper homeostasis protein